jgi:hypothetical protein
LASQSVHRARGREKEEGIVLIETALSKIEDTVSISGRLWGEVAREHGVKLCGECRVPQFVEEFWRGSSLDLEKEHHSCNTCSSDKQRTAGREYYKRKRDSIREKYARRTEEQIRHHREWSRRYREVNAEKLAERESIWKRNNPDRTRMHTATRRAAKAQRTPAWLTEDDWKWIQWMYTQASRITELTGVQHDVDHIIPLRGKEVSGLHVPQNLQILTHQENVRKGNRLLVENVGINYLSTKFA